EMKRAELDGVRRTLPEVPEVSDVSPEADVVGHESNDAAAGIEPEILIADARHEPRRRTSVHLRAHEAGAQREIGAYTRSMRAAGGNADDEIAHRGEDIVAAEIRRAAEEVRRVAEIELQSGDAAPHPRRGDSEIRSALARVVGEVDADERR